MGRVLGAARSARWLPVGGGLPDEVWRARHAGIVALLWAHAAVVPLFALIRGLSPLHAGVESAILPATALLAGHGLLERRWRTVAASLGLLSASAILVHLSGGVIEMHFHFFVMVAVVALYQDWVPFLAAVGYVFVHHGLMGAIDPDSVFNHEAAREKPWLWAGIHAVFIAAISAACLVTWRLNERALDDRRAAEERLLEESHVVETLHEVGKALSADLDTHHVVQAVTDAATELVGAAFGAFFYNQVDDAGETYMLFTLSGAPRDAFEGFGMPRNTPIFAPTFRGDGVVRIDDVLTDDRYGQNPPLHGMPEGHPPVRSYLAVPVRSRSGEVAGGLFFGHPETARFTEVDERLAVGIASHAAIAFDNARLYESERQARQTSDEQRDQLEVLAEASKVLASPLEVVPSLMEVASAVAPGHAQVCIIDVVDDSGVQRLAWAGERNGLPAWLGRNGEAMAGNPIAAVLDSGHAAPLDDAVVGAVVPLLGRHEVLGALTIASERHVGGTSVSVPFVEELARRVAVAIENNRLYHHQRSVAETLQRSLLPETLPRVAGLQAAARYTPGGPDIEVGGDWYDVFALPGGSLMVAMGDVVGRGERAASLMGQLRNAARVHAYEGRGPGDVAEGVNRFLSEAGSEQMATMVFGVLDPESQEFRFVNGGHPPPLLVRADGTSTFLEAPSGLPLGAMATSSYVEVATPMAAGDCILLYTDGLIERRDESLEHGMERLRRTASAADADDLEALCGAVVAELLGDGPSADDAALLALRLQPLDDTIELTLPAEPGALGPLRSVLRRWLLQRGANEEEIYELLVAAGEACANAIRHANGPQQSEFTITASCDDGIEIVVRDQGRWRERHEDGPGGRGLAIIETFVDDLAVTTGEHGTELRMRRRLAQERQAATT